MPTVLGQLDAERRRPRQMCEIGGRDHRVIAAGEDMAGDAKRRQSPAGDGVGFEIRAGIGKIGMALGGCCLLYTSEAADDPLCVAIGGPRIIKKKKNT